MSNPHEAATDIPDATEVTPYEELPRATPVDYYDFTPEQRALKTQYVAELVKIYPNVPEDILELTTAYYLRNGEEKVAKDLADGKFDSKSK